MKTSLMRVLAALVLVVSALMYQENAQAADAAAAVAAASEGAEMADCFILAVQCVGTGGFPEETFQICYANWIWQGFECRYFFGYTWGDWCGPISYGCDDTPCDPNDPNGCDA